MDIDNLTERIIEGLGHYPTQSQTEAAYRIADFLLQRGAEEFFVIQGYAGTGKTTLIKALSQLFANYGYETVLLAPTGRAAKVISGYSGKPAHTIHRYIYYVDSRGGQMNFRLSTNRHKNTFFIIDEASMLSDSRYESASLSHRSLLEDLISYVRSGVNCRMFFVGDTAQLPPIGTEESPALDPDYLKRNFAILGRGAMLRDVVRQERESGVLYNATELREMIESYVLALPQFNLNFPDVIRITDGYEFEEWLSRDIQDDPKETVLICRSNKRANLYNQQIRARTFYRDTPISGGDRVMVVKNNYFWDTGKKGGFLANGDMAEIESVRNIRELHGFTFADASMVFDDGVENFSIEATIMLDVFNDDGPSLSQKRMNELYENVLLDYQDVFGKRAKMEKLKSDVHFQALQLKFAYAITGHKAQGGQWKNVYLEYPYLADENEMDLSYLRWLYTAFTRATEKIYLIGFPETFFEE